MPDKEAVRPLARHLVAEKAVEPHGARRILRQVPLAPMLMGGSDVLREKVEVELVIVFSSSVSTLSDEGSGNTPAARHNFAGSPTCPSALSALRLRFRKRLYPFISESAVARSNVPSKRMSVELNKSEMPRTLLRCATCLGVRGFLTSSGSDRMRVCPFTSYTIMLPTRPEIFPNVGLTIAMSLYFKCFAFCIFAFRLPCLLPFLCPAYPLA